MQIGVINCATHRNCTNDKNGVHSGHMYQRLYTALYSRSFFLFGARGTGKTSLLREHFADKNPVLWLDLLDVDLERSLLVSPGRIEQLIPRGDVSGKWVVIDEIQKVPALLNHVHRLIESRGLKFALTGSSARKLRARGVNLLGGRASSFQLFPLTHAELGERFTLNEALEWGGLPAIWNTTDPSERYEILRGYVNTYIREEIKNEQLVRKLEPFFRFIEVAAQMNGEIVNRSKIARDSGVDAKAVERYYEILTDTLIGVEIPPFARPIRRRQSQRAKYYFFDTGVVRGILNRLKVSLTPGSGDYGHAFEHFVTLELLRLNEYLRLDWRFSYLRTKDDLEIDLVIERPTAPLLLVEIKSAARVDDTEVSRRAALKKDLDPCELVVLCNEPRMRRLEFATIYPWQAGIAAITNSEVC
jgi:predicted AAA+ superfamily ATPase